jgi:hypothetical protein
MRRVLWLSLVLAALAAPSALGATARERQVPGPLSAVSIAGTEVAYADEYRSGCHEVRLWDVALRGDRRLSSHCFVSTSTGSGIAAVEATGGRALWLTYTGGNIREWSLWTKGGSGKARRISFLPADVDGPAPVVLGRLWEGSLPYAVGRTIVVLLPNGSRKFTLTGPDRVVSLSAHSRGYAAVLANGHVLTISQQGALLRDRAFDPGFAQEAVLAGPGLIVKTRQGIQIVNGDSSRTIALPAGARFLGYAQGFVAYGTGRELRLLKLVNEQDTLFKRLAPRFQAQLGRRGMVYASGRTLGFTAWALLAASGSG